MKSDVKKITMGAVMVAFVGIVLIWNRYTAGMVETYFTFLLPLPISIYTAKYGLKEALTPVIATLIMTLVIAEPTTIFFVFNGAITGVIYGAGVYQHRSNRFLLATTIFFSALSGFITTMLFASFFGFSMQEEIDFLVNTLGTEVNRDLLSMTIPDFIRLIFPAAILLTAVMEGSLVHLLAQMIMKRLGITVNEFKTIDQMNIPKWVGCLCLVFSISPVLVSFMQVHHFITEICYTLSVISLFIFLIYGFITIVWLIRVFGRPSFVFLFYLIFFVAFGYMVPMIVLVGAIDTFVDVKKRIINRGHNAGKS